MTACNILVWYVWVICWSFSVESKSQVCIFWSCAVLTLTNIMNAICLVNHCSSWMSILGPIYMSFDIHIFVNSIHMYHLIVRLCISDNLYENNLIIYPFSGFKQNRTWRGLLILTILRLLLCMSLTSHTNVSSECAFCKFIGKWSNNRPLLSVSYIPFWSNSAGEVSKA